MHYSLPDTITTNINTQTLDDDPSNEWDNILEKMYLNFNKFPEIAKLIDKYNITIGSVLAAETIQVISKSAVSNLDLRKELFTGIDYISFLSLSVFGSVLSIENKVINIAINSRIAIHQSKDTLLEDELSIYMFDTQESLNVLMHANKWLVVVYMFAYVYAFIGSPEIDKES